MSLRRFVLYFLALTACGMTAFPHWEFARRVSNPVTSPEENAAVLLAARNLAVAHRMAVLSHRAESE